VRFGKILENDALVRDVLELLSPILLDAVRLFDAAEDAFAAHTQTGGVLFAVERLGLDLDEPRDVAVFLEDVDADEAAIPEEGRLEERNAVAFQELESRGDNGGRVAILELDAARPLRGREGFDHVAALGEELQVGVAGAVVRVAVFTEEELRVAGASDAEIGFGEGAVHGGISKARQR